MAKSKRPVGTRRVRSKAGEPGAALSVRPADDTGATRADSATAASHSPSPPALAERARSILTRSGWQPAQQDRLSQSCRELLARLSATCDGVVATIPLKPGEVGGEIPIATKDFGSLLAEAAGARKTPNTVWCDGTNELLVGISRIVVKTAKGLVGVTIPVECVETGPKTVTVTFATGSQDSPAGLIAAASTRPDGPAEIVDIWGEPLVALSWTALLRAVAAIADGSGTDLDGAGLVPAAITAHDAGLSLLVMARHEMDRKPR